jgi:hypothetical protein
VQLLPLLPLPLQPLPLLPPLLLWTPLLSFD